MFGWKAETLQWYKQFNVTEAVKRSIPMVKHRGKPLSLEQYAPQWDLLQPKEPKNFAADYAKVAESMLKSGRMKVIDG